MKLTKKQKEVIENSIKVLINKPIKEVARVPIDEITEYREFDRKNEPIKGGKYLKSLITDIKKNGFKEPIRLNISGLITEGNHRLAAAIEMGLRYVPVQMSYSDLGSINKHKAKRIPQSFHQKFDKFWR